MSTVRYGERVGKEGLLRVGASALVLDEAREKVLMTQREDNGGMDPGESAAEACLRELVEETGLEARVVRLVGIYTTPDLLIEYPDGNKIQPVSFSFEVEVIGGELVLTDETLDVGYYTVAEIEAMDTYEHHLFRIHDALKNLSEAVYQ